MESALEAVSRHPELYCCQPDEIVFEAGTRHTVPLGAAMRFLMRGDETALMAALRGGA